MQLDIAGPVGWCGAGGRKGFAAGGNAAQGGAGL